MSKVYWRYNTILYFSLTIALESILCIALVVATKTQTFSVNTSILQSRSISNEAAGSDLYGIGVRVGLYHQGFAFLLSDFRTETRIALCLLVPSLPACLSSLDR